MPMKFPLAEGAQVEHARFGLGSVISCDDERTVIYFDEYGEKKFVTSMVLPDLKASDREPPVIRRRRRRSSSTGTRRRKKGAQAG